MFENLVEKLKKNPTTLVFTEGPDPRILEAAARLKREHILEPLLVGNPDEVKAAAEKGGFDITDIRIVDPANYRRMDELVDKMVELRKGKMSPDECRAALSKGPALQLVKTKPGSKSVSSCFLLVRERPDGSEEKYIMGDCAINIEPSAEELAETAIECARSARIFGIDPKVAMLSFSTKGSAKGEKVDKVTTALALAKEAAPDLAIDGELQFDAAFSPVVAQTKCKGSPVAGQANVFVFPEIQSGNIGYKIAQRLGGFAAYGPILQGLNAPINDLSRGCDAEEVYNMALITAGLK